jgi:hypothetical protein
MVIFHSYVSLPEGIIDGCGSFFNGAFPQSMAGARPDESSRVIHTVDLGFLDVDHMAPWLNIG